MLIVNSLMLMVLDYYYNLTQFHCCLIAKLVNVAAVLLPFRNIIECLL